MEIRKCDRCGAISTNYFFEDTGIGNHIETTGYTRCRISKHRSFDICPACMKIFMEDFMRFKKEDTDV